MSQYSNATILKRLINYGQLYPKVFYGNIIVAIGLALVSAYRPYYITLIINDAIKDFKGNGMDSQYDTLLYMCLILVVLVVAETILSYFLSYYSNVLSQNIIKKIRLQLYDKLVHFKTAYFDKTALGTLVTRSVSDIETIATVYNDGILLFLGDILRIVVIVVFMFALNVKLALISMILFPLMYIVTRIFQKAIKKTFSDERTFTSQLNSFVQERLSGMSLVQVFNQQEQEQQNFSQYNRNLLNANIQTIFYFSLFFPVVELISALAIGLIIFFGSYEVLQEHNISEATLIGFIMYIQMLTRPLRQIADRFNTIQRGLVGAERVFKLIDSEMEIPNIGKQQPEVMGHIEFEDVYFSYLPNEPVLKGLSFAVNKGEEVAIVGSTGAGKSTIINLISRLYEIDKGAIKIDGIDIKNFELKYLREQISMVLQDVFLFNDSLYNNIILGNENISKEEVKNAAKEIGIHDFIESLPNGYDYVVSERGSSLSAGQRQLISFLRAYVHNPNILILDEATSSIDTISEELIQNATYKITRNRTSIIVAHRLATIKSADKIMVLDDGHLVEEGSHNELLKKKGFYYNLYQSQFQDDIVEK